MVEDLSEGVSTEYRQCQFRVGFILEHSHVMGAMRRDTSSLSVLELVWSAIYAEVEDIVLCIVLEVDQHHPRDRQCLGYQRQLVQRRLHTLRLQDVEGAVVEEVAETVEAFREVSVEVFREVTVEEH